MNEPNQQPELTEEQWQILADLFGSVVFAYTRAQAIADGVLVPIPELELSIAGFVLPMAVNETVYAAARAQELEHRQEMLAQCMTAVREREDKNGNRVYFPLRLPHGGAMDVVLDCGPGDEGEPVLTLCQPHEL